MPESDWLNQNAHRFYPFVPTADFEVSSGAFDGKSAFADVGFTLGISSAFENARDLIYLDRYYKSTGIIRFVFRLRYGDTATYEAMQCYEWVFEFPDDAPFGSTVYAIPTRIEEFDLIGEESPEMGLGFVTAGDLDVALVGAVNGDVSFTQEPSIEPAALQSSVDTFVNAINLANEDRPCPPDCCPSSSSGSSDSSSSESSSDSSSESSSSSSSPDCEDPTPPEPAELDAPSRMVLPDGQFVGDVKLKPGYNCRIILNKAQNTVNIQSGLERGEGMQCEDLRTDDEGNLIPETCRDCSGMVYAVENHGADVEDLQLVGGPGVLILPDADNHRIVVRLEEEGICEVEV